MKSALASSNCLREKRISSKKSRRQNFQQTKLLQSAREDHHIIFLYLKLALVDQNLFSSSTSDLAQSFGKPLQYIVDQKWNWLTFRTCNLGTRAWGSCTLWAENFTPGTLPFSGHTESFLAASCKWIDHDKEISRPAGDSLTDTS